MRNPAEVQYTSRLVTWGRGPFIDKTAFGYA